MNDLRRVDLDALRYITNTAATLPVSHVARLRELFPRVRIYSMYGLTECKRVSYLPPEQLDARPLSVGKGMPNEEVYLVNEAGQKVGPGPIGELVVRGSNVMLGYWNLPEETARCLRPGPYPGERVLYTGDLFTMDEEGYLYFVARTDDIIKCAGENEGAKAFGKAFWEALGEKANPRIVFEHPGQATIPTSNFVCERGGMIVICAGTSGFDTMIDVRYLWFMQKRYQGSHMFNDEQAAAFNDLVRENKVRTTLGHTYDYTEADHVHQLMGDGQLPEGNVAVLINAPERGLTDTP